MRDSLSVRAHLARVAFAVTVFAPVVVACTAAPATEVGGVPRFDLTPPSAEAQCAGDPTADAGDGHAFADLYRDYFGPTAKSSCAGTTGNCHGSADALGAIGSGGYVCGATADACWQGMKTAGLTDTNAGSNPMLAVLRRCDGSGSMPQQPTSFYFYADDLQRIKDWLAAGALDD